MGDWLANRPPMLKRSIAIAARRYWLMSARTNAPLRREIPFSNFWVQLGVIMNPCTPWGSVASTRAKEAQMGRNPKTGAAVKVPAKKIAFFRPSRELKELLQ